MTRSYREARSGNERNKVEVSSTLLVERTFQTPDVGDPGYEYCVTGWGSQGQPQVTDPSASPTGYQRQLTYRHPDGSYSAFGERDASGSMW